MSEKQIIHCATHNLFIQNYILFQKDPMKIHMAQQDKMTYLRKNKGKLNVGKISCPGRSMYQINVFYKILHILGLRGWLLTLIAVKKQDDSIHYMIQYP